jgi:hypothetical protein
MKTYLKFTNKESTANVAEVFSLSIIMVRKISMDVCGKKDFL